MVNRIFQPEWRTQNRRRRRFFAVYMRWLERAGYVAAIGLMGLFAYSFVWPTDEWIVAEDVPFEAAPVPSAAFVAPSEIFIESKLVDDGARVEKGQPLVRYFEGPDARVFRALSDLREVPADPAAREDLKHLESLLRLQVRTFLAKSSGWVRFSAERSSLLPKGTKVVEVLNGSQWILSGAFSGKSVSQARVGQSAEVSNLKFTSSPDVAVFGQVGGKGFVSREALSSDFMKSVREVLLGSTVRAPQDLSLRIDEVEAFEIEARFEEVGRPPVSDPLPGETLKGTVREGRHRLIGQLALLPPGIRSQVESALEMELERNGLRVEGEPRYLFKFSASDAAEVQTPMEVASLKRSYEATVVVENVPPDLLKRVLDAQRLGRKVTARVRIKTGTRSLASMLLRRS